MLQDHADLLASLREHQQPIQPEDPIAEAGRKILLDNFIRMLERSAGSRSGEDIEDVHQMRVAIRRMRSAFRLLDEHYKAKPVGPFKRHLRWVARLLGDVRDLDVMIDNLEKYVKGLDADEAAAMHKLIKRLDKKRRKARARLVEGLDQSLYDKFVRAFAVFLTTPGKAAISPDSTVTPHQVRHVTPVLFYEKLAAVRAYDAVIEAHAGDDTPDIDAETLHALRIEFKRLRYAVTFFKDVLGNSVNEFIDEIKTMQDYLGRLNDVVVARERLQNLRKLSEGEKAARDRYLAMLEDEAQASIHNFPEVWAHFNTRTVQSKFTNSLLVLR